MKELFAKARKRDPDAFSEIVHQMMPDMYKAGRAILSNEEDVSGK